MRNFTMRAVEIADRYWTVAVPHVGFLIRSCTRYLWRAYSLVAWASVAIRISAARPLHGSSTRNMPSPPCTTEGFYTRAIGRICHEWRRITTGRQYDMTARRRPSRGRRQCRRHGMSDTITRDIASGPDNIAYWSWSRQPLRHTWTPPRRPVYRRSFISPTATTSVSTSSEMK